MRSGEVQIVELTTIVPVTLARVSRNTLALFAGVCAAAPVRLQSAPGWIDAGAHVEVLLLHTRVGNRSRIDRSVGNRSRILARLVR